MVKFILLLLFSCSLYTTKLLIPGEIMKYTIGIILMLIAFSLSYSQEAIAIHPLKASGIEKSQAEVLTDAIRTEISQLNKFDIMERSEMENILKEQGFQASGACDDDACALEMGKILAVRYMILGNVGLLGKTYSISIRLVDVATGKIVRDKSEYYKGEIDKLLTEVVPSLSEKLVDGFSNKEEDSRTVNENSEGTPKKKKRGGLIAGISLGVAAAAAVPLVLILTSDDSEESSDPTETDITISWE